MSTIEYWQKLAKKLSNPTPYPSRMNSYLTKKRLSLEGKIEILVPQRDNYMFINDKEVKPIKK